MDRFTRGHTRKTAIAIATVTAVVGASTALVWGGANERLSTKAESFDARAVHQVESPSAPVAKAAKKAKVSYFETASFGIPADGRDDSVLTCPKGKAINGYYGTDGGIVADYLAVGATSVADWEFGLIDLTGLDGNAFLGIVCLKT